MRFIAFRTLNIIIINIKSEVQFHFYFITFFYSFRQFVPISSVILLVFEYYACTKSCIFSIRTILKTFQKEISFWKAFLFLKQQLIFKYQNKTSELQTFSNQNKPLMSLNPLKRIVKSTLNRDPIEQIFWGNPTADTFDKTMHNYRQLPTQYRQEIIARCLKKLAKPKQTDMVIATLVLLHKIMKIDWISLPPRDPQIDDNKKKQKQRVAETAFVKFYYGFLKITEQDLMNQKSTMEQKIAFSESSIDKAMQIIKNKLVIQYCINHSSNQLTLRICLKEIFEEIRENLQFTVCFIEKHAKLIYEQSNQNSFAINQVYEKLVFLSKNMTKISFLVKKAGLDINFPQYQFDRDLNMKIEMDMNSRRAERQKFKTEKLINSRKNIDLPCGMQHPKFSHSLSQIDQDDILIQHQQLL